MDAAPVHVVGAAAGHHHQHLSSQSHPESAEEHGHKQRRPLPSVPVAILEPEPGRQSSTSSTGISSPQPQSQQVTMSSETAGAESQEVQSQPQPQQSQGRGSDWEKEEPASSSLQQRTRPKASSSTSIPPTTSSPSSPSQANAEPSASEQPGALAPATSASAMEAESTYERVEPAESEEKPVGAGNDDATKNGKNPEQEAPQMDDALYAAPGKPHESEEEIIVQSQESEAERLSNRRVPSDQEDEAMPDVGAGEMVEEETESSSHYPKRKRHSLYGHPSQAKAEKSGAGSGDQASSTILQRPKLPKPSPGSQKGVVIGYWRDSKVPHAADKHAVVGFIDIRDRLRTRVQAYSRNGKPLAAEYPLPPGPGGSWIVFDGVAFNDHLVGLDQLQVKEYVRLRTDKHEKTDEERRAAEEKAVIEAKQRVLDIPAHETPVLAPPIAYGAEVPDTATPGRPEKRRKVSGGLTLVNGGQQNGENALQEHSEAGPSSPTPVALDPLLGTRPTHILLGYWKKSSSVDKINAHAVYGILSYNGMFRVKLVRETRDGRRMDGNFPTNPGALWIGYDEVEFESYLKDLSRAEIKEYCRVRQYQIDRGETAQERPSNEVKAAEEAQARCSGAGGSVVRPQTALTTPVSTRSETAARANGDSAASGTPELRQSRRQIEARAGAETRHHLRTPTEAATRSASRAIEKTGTLSRREIGRLEVNQERASRYADHRELAAAAAANEANEAAAAAAAAANANANLNANGTTTHSRRGSPRGAGAGAGTTALPNGRSRFHESEDMQRLNRIWASQESVRSRNDDEVKFYDGVKYERKAKGPLMGRMASQGSLISIDGEEYVEYRVLCKPSFY